MGDTTARLMPLFSLCIDDRSGRGVSVPLPLRRFGFVRGERLGASPPAVTGFLGDGTETADASNRAFQNAQDRARKA